MKMSVQTSKRSLFKIRPVNDVITAFQSCNPYLPQATILDLHTGAVSMGDKFANVQVLV